MSEPKHDTVRERRDRIKDAFARWTRGAGNGESGMTNTEEMQSEEPLAGTAEDGATENSSAEKNENRSATSAVEVEQLRGERDALVDRVARLQAEFDNARKREQKEKQDARDYAVQGAVEPFLSVMDNFQLALKADGSAEQLRAGVELILKQMEDALRALRVEAVESVGTQFDPRIHEALGSIETAEHPDHEVLEEIRRGYRLRDKLLRPALVRIASNPAQVSE
jgi:molecular chaperone GrpE